MRSPSRASGASTPRATASSRTTRARPSGTGARPTRVCRRRSSTSATATPMGIGVAKDEAEAVALVRARRRRGAWHGAAEPWPRVSDRSGRREGRDARADVARARRGERSEGLRRCPGATCARRSTSRSGRRRASWPRPGGRAARASPAGRRRAAGRRRCRRCRSEGAAQRPVSAATVRRWLAACAAGAAVGCGPAADAAAEPGADHARVPAHRSRRRLWGSLAHASRGSDHAEPRRLRRRGRALRRRARRLELDAHLPREPVHRPLPERSPRGAPARPPLRFLPDPGRGARGGGLPDGRRGERPLPEARPQSLAGIRALGRRDLVAHGRARARRRHQPRHAGSRSARFIESERDPARPFFLFAYFWDPHYDYLPPPPYDTRVRRARKRSGSISRASRRNPAIYAGMPPVQLAYILSQYAGEIRATDEYLGRFFALLKREGAVGEHGDPDHRGPRRGVLRPRREGPQEQPVRRDDPRAAAAQAAGSRARPGGRPPRQPRRRAPDAARAGRRHAPTFRSRAARCSSRARPPSRAIFFDLLSTWFYRRLDGSTFDVTQRWRGVRQGDWKLVWREGGQGAPLRALYDAAAIPPTAAMSLAANEATRPVARSALPGAADANPRRSRRRTRPAGRRSSRRASSNRCARSATSTPESG